MPPCTLIFLDVPLERWKTEAVPLELLTEFELKSDSDSSKLAALMTGLFGRVFFSSACPLLKLGLCAIEYGSRSCIVGKVPPPFSEASLIWFFRL